MKAQIAIIYTASALLMLAGFHKPLGISDAWAGVFSLAAIICLIGFFVLRRRQKARGEQPPALAPSQARRKTQLMLVLVIIVSLSGPLWLPYTGTNLSFRQLIGVSIVSCIFSIGAVLLGARLRSKI